ISYLGIDSSLRVGALLSRSVLGIQTKGQIGPMNAWIERAIGAVYLGLMVWAGLYSFTYLHSNYPEMMSAIAPIYLAFWVLCLFGLKLALERLILRLEDRSRANIRSISSAHWATGVLVGAFDLLQVKYAEIEELLIRAFDVDVHSAGLQPAEGHLKVVRFIGRMRSGGSAHVMRDSLRSDDAPNISNWTKQGGNQMWVVS